MLATGFTGPGASLAPYVGASIGAMVGEGAR